MDQLALSELLSDFLHPPSMFAIAANFKVYSYTKCRFIDIYIHIPFFPPLICFTGPAGLASVNEVETIKYVGSTRSFENKYRTADRCRFIHIHIYIHTYFALVHLLHEKLTVRGSM